jgi:hypothetical protein
MGIVHAMCSRIFADAGDDERMAALSREKRKASP